MAISDTKKIIALSILILLYACIPILIFFLVYVAIFDALNILNYFTAPNVDNGINVIKYSALFLATLYILNKLIKWVKK